VVSFLHEGLARGKRALFVGTALEYEQLQTGLEDQGICSTRAQASRALISLTPEEAYLDDGVFRPEQVLARVERYVHDAIADGFTGLSATGEVIHVPTDELWRQIVWYEAQINETFARLPFSGLCRYPRAVVPASRVRDVLRTHPVAMVRGESCDNPFYERGALALSDDAQSRVDWQLRQMRVQNRARRQMQGKTVSAVTAAVALATELETLRSTIRSTETS